MRTALELGRVAALTAALVGVGPTVATGFDLTGVWTGSVTCKSLVDGAKETTSAAPTVRVTQTGDAIGAEVDVGGVLTRYTGLANPDGKKPLTKGEFGLIRCGTDSGAGLATATDEMGRFTATTKAAPAVKASVKGSSVVAEPAGVGTCTWKWTRTALDDHAVATTCAP